MEELEGGFMQSSQLREYTGMKTLRCLTMKQMNSMDLEDSSVQLVDRVEVTNIQACGYVTSTKKISTGHIFELDDTTGCMECAFWTNAAFEELSAEQIQEGALLRVIGSIKVFSKKKTFNVSFISREDGNALVRHLISSTYQHLYNTNRLERREEKRPSLKLSRIQNDILDVYRKNQSEEGLEADVVVVMLNEKYGEKEIRNNIEGLVNNCYLHSVDGTSYKTTI